MLKKLSRRLRDFLLRPLVEELGELRKKQAQVADLDGQLDEIRQFCQHTDHFTTEQIKTLKLMSLGPDRIIAFMHQGMIPIRFYVPKGGVDFIQSFQLTYESFYEAEILANLNDFVKGKAVLDIGANVGNHVVYWSKVSKAKTIKAFEPIPELFGILERNVAINELANVGAFNFALGRATGFGSPSSNAANRMMSEIIEGADADGIKIAALDDLGIEEADFVKIDVEGFTLGVLQGAQQTLQRLRPALFVEIFDRDMDDCYSLLSAMGYQKVLDYPDYNYFFVHHDRPFTGELPAGLPA